jgi:hypothetical protein
MSADNLNVNVFIIFILVTLIKEGIELDSIAYWGLQQMQIIGTCSIKYKHENGARMI